MPSTFTTFEVIFVLMAMIVLPAPLCAALIPIEITLKTMPPMMIRKYMTAVSCVSSADPQKRMIWLAKSTQSTDTAATDTRINQSAVSRIRFASSFFCSPRRLATSADMETLIAINSASPMNLGCVVSPTAATAYEPMELTISESIMPASDTKKDSHTAGHAICNVSFTILSAVLSLISNPIFPFVTIVTIHLRNQHPAAQR